METGMKKTRRVGRPGRLLPLCLAVLLPAAGSMSVQAKEASLEEYLDMPLEDLLSMEVSSVSRKLQKVRESAAAVYVVTGEDIHRMGARTIPEALRMVPGVQVAKISSGQEVVSVRGFNGRWSNKLLVLIDGRSVYMPSFSGVYWDEQDILLENVERIEVIRGPGATLWGANAVNGIINIITRHAADVRGGMVYAGGGSYDRSAVAARYGASLNDATAGYAHAGFVSRDDLVLLGSGADAEDAWKSRRAGFRLDGEAGAGNEWMLQGEAVDNTGTQLDATSLTPTVPTGVRSHGWHLLGRWQRNLAEDEAYTLQVYYDYINRDENFIEQTHDTVDVDFQYRMQLSVLHDLIWGLGYRRVDDEFENTPTVSAIPDSRERDFFSAFVQDEISLRPDTLKLVLGSKIEHNPYTGFEIQPNIRAIWHASEASTWWASVARAVRTPSRIETDGRITVAVPLPPPAPPASFTIFGNPDQHSEELTAYEIGYRWNSGDRFSLDLATFYNRYDRLFSNVPLVPLNPLSDQLFANSNGGNAWGGELALEWRVRDDWRLKASYSHTRISVEDESGVTQRQFSEGTPRHQLAVHSSHDLSESLLFDLWGQYVDEVPVASSSAQALGLVVDNYATLNLRLAWTPVRNLELSVAGKNLLDDRHLEYLGELYTPPTEVTRSVYAQARWEWR